MSNSYQNRKYLKDARTGERLFTTVMYDGDMRIVGTREVQDRLLTAIPQVAMKLGGKNLITRDFIEAFQIRGPNYGDVVRIAMDKLVAEKKMVKRNISKASTPRYRFDLVSQNL